MPVGKLNKNTEVILSSIKANFSAIAQGIFETTYLRPFNGSKKDNLYELPVERVSHGVQHVSRVALYLPILINFFRSLGYPKEIMDLTESEITLLQLAALFHDSARENDHQTDRWEKKSADLFINFLKQQGIDDEAALNFSQYITRTLNDPLNDLLQSADSLDIMSSKPEFILERNCVFRWLKDEHKKAFLDLAIEIRQLMADQHDLKHDCHITLNGKVVCKSIKKTRDRSKPTLKQSYEQAENGFNAQEKCISHYPFLSQLYAGTTTIESANFAVLDNFFNKSLAVNLQNASIFTPYDNNGYFLAFVSAEEAQACLEQIKSLLKSDIPAFSKASVSKYTAKESKTPYRFRIMTNQLDMLRKKIRESAPSLKPSNDFYFKSIRGDIFNYWEQFVKELIDTGIQYVKRTGTRKNFTTNGQGIFKRNPVINSHYPLKRPQYTNQEKQGFTKFQSMTLGMINFFPPVFGFDKRNTLLAGMMFNPVNILPSNRHYIYDGGTVDLPYDFWQEEDAKTYADDKVNKLLFSSDQLGAFKAALQFKTNRGKHNESLSRLRLNVDNNIERQDQEKIFIGSDNLESRLLAKQYAYDATKRLLQAGKCSKDYRMPICFYIPDQPDLLFKEYTQAEYQLDCFEARLIYSTEALKKEKYKNNQYEFLFALSPDEIKKELSQPVNGTAFAIDLLRNGHVHIVKFLVEKCNFDLGKAFEDAVRSTNSIESNAELASSILHHLIRTENEELALNFLHRLSNTVTQRRLIVQKMQSSRTVPSPLFIAAEKNKPDFIRAMLFYGATTDILYKQETPLYIAAQARHLEVVRVLLAATEICTVNYYCHWFWGSGYTALYVASQNGHLAVVKALLEKGANVNAACDGGTPLYIAAKNGHLDVVKALLEKDADVNAADGNGLTPLQIAVFNRHTEVVKILLVYKAKVNAVKKDGVTLLYIAAQNGYHDIVKALLEENADDVNAADDDGLTPLHLAAKNGHLDVVNALLAKNANVNAADKYRKETPLYIAAKNGHLDVVNALLAKNANVNAADIFSKTPLHIAVQNGHLDVVKALLEKGADVNATEDDDDLTPLHIAAKNGHLDVVKALLEKGADVNAADIFSKTPLHLAAKNGHLDVVKALLAKNANNAADDDGLTPLHIAAKTGHLEIAEALIAAHKGSVYARCKKHTRPLHHAALGGHTKIVKTLLAHQAYVNATNKDKDTPLHLAAFKGQTEVVKILLAHKSNTAICNHYGKTPLDLIKNEPALKSVFKKQELINYIEKKEKGWKNDAYKTYFQINFFGHKFALFGFTRDQKLNAAKALKNVVEGNADLGTLNQYEHINEKKFKSYVDLLRC